MSEAPGWHHEQGYRAIDSYTEVRLHRWLRRKHDKAGKRAGAYLPQLLYERYGLARLPSLVEARRGRRRDALSESRMQGDPHVRFDEQGVEMARPVSPTGEPHDPDSTPCSCRNLPVCCTHSSMLKQRNRTTAWRNFCGSSEQTVAAPKPFSRRFIEPYSNA